MIAVVMVTLAALAVFFGVGVLGLRAAGVRGWGFPPVVAVVIGHVACVSLFAVVVSHGRSSMSPLLVSLLVAVPLWRRFGVRPSQEAAGRLDVAALAEQAAVAAVAAVVMSWPLFVDGQLLYPGLQQDNLHYIRLAAFVNDLGVECPSANRVLGVMCRRAPYHFFDLWTAALISRTGLHMTLAFSGVSAGVLASNLYGACRGLARRLGAGRLAGVVALAALMAAPEALLVRWLSEGFMVGTSFFASHILFANKLLPASLMLTLAVWAWTTPAAMLTPLLVAAAACVQSTTAPFAGVVVSMLLAHDLWRGERSRSWAGMAAMGMLGGVGVWFFVEARVLPGYGSISDTNMVGYLGSRLYLRTAVNVVGKTTLQMLLQVAPYILLAVLTWPLASTRDRLRSRHTRLGLGLLGLGLATSLGLWATIHYYTDSTQVFGNTSTSLFPMVIVCVLAGALEPQASRRRVGRVALGVILVAGLAGSTLLFRRRVHDLDVAPSAPFRSAAISLLAGAPGLGVRFIDASTMTQYVDKNIALGSPEYLLAAAPSSYEVVIPVGEVPLASNPLARSMELARLRLGLFYEFAERETGALSNDPDTIRRYVATRSFDHVVCEGSAAQKYCLPQACEGDSAMAYCRAGGIGQCIQEGSFRLCRPDR